MNVVDSKEYSNLQRMTAGEAIIDQCYGYPNGISLQMRNCASDLLKQFIVNRPLRVNNMYAAVFACITIASQQLPNSRIYDSKLISYIFPIETKIGDMNKSIRRYMKEIQQIAKLPELTKEQQIEKNINVLCNRIQNPMLCSQVSRFQVFVYSNYTNIDNSDTDCIHFCLLLNELVLLPTTVC